MLHHRHQLWWFSHPVWRAPLHVTSKQGTVKRRRSRKRMKVHEGTSVQGRCEMELRVSPSGAPSQKRRVQLYGDTGLASSEVVSETSETISVRSEARDARDAREECSLCNVETMLPQVCEILAGATAMTERKPC